MSIFTDQLIATASEEKPRFVIREAYDRWMNDLEFHVRVSTITRILETEHGSAALRAPVCHSSANLAAAIALLLAEEHAYTALGVTGLPTPKETIDE